MNGFVRDQISFNSFFCTGFLSSGSDYDYSFDSFVHFELRFICQYSFEIVFD